MTRPLPRLHGHVSRETSTVGAWAYLSLGATTGLVCTIVLMLGFGGCTPSDAPSTGAPTVQAPAPGVRA